MATPPPYAAPPPSSPSASNSATPATHPSPQPPQVEGSTNNGFPDAVEQKPEIAESFVDIDSPEVIEKYKKYEADYTRYLMAKYFSKKNIYGGYIFEEKTAIGDEIIQSSRWHCTRSFADPLQAYKDLSSSSCSTPTAEIQTHMSNGKQPVKNE